MVARCCTETHSILYTYLSAVRLFLVNQVNLLNFTYFPCSFSSFPKVANLILYTVSSHSRVCEARVPLHVLLPRRCARREGEPHVAGGAAPPP